MRKYLYYILLFVFFALHSCSTQKNIPEGKYLLNEVNIETDDKNISKEDMALFLRQTPNSSLPLLGKFRLKIYNMAGSDTTWLTKLVRKMGEPPVIYNPGLTSVSAQQIKKQLENQGYLFATVDTVLQEKDTQMNVTYKVNGRTPYTIRNYELDSLSIPPNLLRSFNMYKSRRSVVKQGALFDQEKLEEERTNITNMLRNFGYYSFSKDFLYYKADTTLQSNQVDLFLSLYPEKDSVTFQRYNIRNTTITSGFDPVDPDNAEYFSHPDTVMYKDIKIIHGSNNFLRKSTLARNTILKPGRRYSDMAYSRTFSAFSGMGSIKQTDIRVIPVDMQPGDTVRFVDVDIKVAPANVHWMQVGVEGTNTAGDLGIAPNISYRHQNLFNGGEILNLKLKGSYEFIPGSKSDNLLNKSYYEIGFDAGLSFPQFLFPFLRRSWRELPSASTQFSIGLNNQHRREYTRQFFNSTVNYRWSTRRNSLNHSIDIIDINYIRMPWIDDDFKNNYLNDSTNTLLRTMYQDQLIARHGYNFVYTKANSFGRISKSTYTFRFGAEIGGPLPRLFTSLNKEVKRNSLDQKTFMGIAYAEYWKGDVSFSKTHIFSNQNSVAYRVGLGVAYPFGNSTVLPFEKRYFAGGSNGVRGWSTRRLGPGSYKAKDGANDFINQVGDIKIDLNFEYRARMSEFIEIAGFVDGGNIWTIKDYEEQPGGYFTFSSFYKEIALSYGLGLRFDLGFLLLRLDGGMKAYDPGRDEGDRWVIHRPKFNRDFAWHFAIGYPF